MAVDADQIEEITRGVVGLYRAAEQAILQRVTRALGQGMDAPDWAARRMGALSTLRRAVERILGIVADAGAQGIREMLARAYRTGEAAATRSIPAQLLPRDPDAVRAASLVADLVPRAGVVENLATALVADVGERHSNVVRHVEDVYRQVIAEATAASVAGGITRREASQIAYQRLVDQGITSFVDRRGRRWRLTSYVEMAVRTVTQRAAVQGETDRLTRLGLPFVIVSNEVQECVRCRPFEGKVLRITPGPTGRLTVPHATTGAPVTIDVLTTLPLARAAGLQHPNCRHSIRVYLPGITKRPEKPTADPEGDKARQRQRYIERQIRRWKERQTAALDPAAKRAAAAKVRAWQAEMRDHLEANPTLKRLPYREAIGAGNLPPGARAAPATPTPAPPPPSPPLPQRRPVTEPPQRPEGLAGMLEADLESAAGREATRDALADVINGDYAGLTVEVQEVVRYPFFGPDADLPGLLTNIGIFNDADVLSGNEVGRCQRAFYRDSAGDLVAVHAFLQLAPAIRGKGFASEFNAQLERWYREQGIVRIELHADIDVGGYTWASHGYDFADEESADGVLGRLEFVIERYTDEVLALRERARAATGQAAADLVSAAAAIDAQLEQAHDIVERALNGRFGDDGYPSAYEISQCGRTAGANRWLGKDAMLGTDWQGVKWL